MESPKQTIANSSDEIDLLQLFAKVILVIKRYLLIIASTFFIGTIFGFIYFQVSPKVYESRMLITSEVLTESYSKALIENLDQLIEEKGFQSLSEKLGLPPDLSSKITSIEVKSALEKPGDTPENVKIYLSIEVRVKDNTSWSLIQNGIIKYFQNNEFVRIRVELAKKYVNEVIKKIDQEIIDLEELKVRIAEGSLIQSNKQNLVLFDPTTVNSKILDLNKERISLQNSLITIESVQLVEGFTVFIKPASPRLSISLIAGSIFGLFLAGAIIAFKAVGSVVRYSEEKLSNS